MLTGKMEMVEIYEQDTIILIKYNGASGKP